MKKKPNFIIIASIFYLFAFLVLLYAIYTMITSYQDIGQYISNQNIDMAQLSNQKFSYALSSSIPFYMNALILYGIGYIIKHFEMIFFVTTNTGINQDK